MSNKGQQDGVPAVIDTTGEEIVNEMYLQFSAPYEFEGKTYDGVDLSGMADMTGRDMIAVQRKLERGGTVSVLPEMSLEYAIEFAARASHQPPEFFQGRPPREAIKLKNRVMAFLYGGD